MAERGKIVGRELAERVQKVGKALAQGKLAKKRLKNRWKKICGKMADTIVSREFAERGKIVGR